MVGSEHDEAADCRKAADSEEDVWDGGKVRAKLRLGAGDCVADVGRVYSGVADCSRGEVHCDVAECSGRVWVHFCSLECISGRGNT